MHEEKRIKKNEQYLLSSFKRDEIKRNTRRYKKENENQMSSLMFLEFEDDPPRRYKKREGRCGRMPHESYRYRHDMFDYPNDPPFGEGLFSREGTEDRVARKTRKAQEDIDEIGRLEQKAIIEARKNELKSEIRDIRDKEAVSDLAVQRHNLERELGIENAKLEAVNKTLSFRSRYF